MEISRDTERLTGNIRAIALMGKGERDGCPLANLIVEESGIKNRFARLGEPGLALEFSDYNVFFRAPQNLKAWGGEIGLQLENQTFAARTKEIKGAKGISIGVVTWYTDNFGRPVEFTAFLEGVDDVLRLSRSEQWTFFKSLFPGVTFKEFPDKLAREELEKLAAQKIIPHAPVKL